MTTWATDTDTGNIDFDVSADGAGLAKQSGLCQFATCYLVFQGGRADPGSGDVTPVISLPGQDAGATSQVQPWTIHAHAARTAWTTTELTHVRAVVYNGSGQQLASSWQVVHDPYPASVVTENVSKWDVDTDTGKIGFEVTGDGVGLAKHGGVCESQMCLMVFQTGRVDSSTGGVGVVGELPGQDTGRDYQTIPWSVRAHAAASGWVSPEVTHVRAVVITGNGQQLASSWQVAHDPYPASVVTENVTKWDVDTDTGQIDFAITGDGVGLAKHGGVCESQYCLMIFQGGRVDSSTGDVQVVGTLSGQNIGAEYQVTPWTIHAHAAQTAWTSSELTQVRAVIVTSNGQQLASPWTEVHESYPDPAINAVTVTNWEVDTHTGKITYDVSTDGRVLGKHGSLCEANWCFPRFEAGRSTGDGEIETVISLPGYDGTAQVNPTEWTAHMHAAATDWVAPEITYVRAVVQGNGVSLATDWVAVHPTYPVPAISLDVRSWDADTQDGTVSYDIHAGINGLDDHGLPCETQQCRLQIEYGIPNPTTGYMAATGTLSTQQYNYANPGQWTLDLDATSDHLVLDATHIRAALYDNSGNLLLATNWQERTTSPVTGTTYMQASALAAVAIQIQDPCIEIFPIGTHYEESSLNDQQIACEAGRQAGTGWKQLIERIASTPQGRAAIQAGITSLGILVATEVLIPVMEDAGTLTMVLAVALSFKERTKGPRTYIDVAIYPDPALTLTAARECVKQGIESKLDPDVCKSDAVLFVGADAQTASEHDEDVITQHPELAQLHYRPAGESHATETPAACRGMMPVGGFEGTTQCDEYPFRSSSESGSVTDFRLIPTAHNQKEGNAYNGMTIACGHRTDSNARKPYVVIPAHRIAPSSFYVCGEGD